MGVFKRCSELLDNVEGLREGQTTLFAGRFLDVGAEILTDHQFHGDKHGGTRPADPVKIIDRGNIGMGQFLLPARFAL